MIDKTQEKKHEAIILDIIKKEIDHIKANWPLLLVCFFISRQNIIDEIFPFAILVLIGYFYYKGPWISVLVLCIAGISSIRFNFIYTIILIALYGYFLNFNKDKDKEKKSIFLISGYSALLLFVSKTAILVADGLNSNGFFLNIFEGIFVFSGIILLVEGIKRIEKIKKQKKSIKNLPKGKENEAAITKSEPVLEKTSSDVTIEKHKKKNKYINIFSENAKSKIIEYLLWQNINVKFFEVQAYSKSSIILSVTVKTKKTPEEAEGAIVLAIRNITGAKLICFEKVLVSPNYYVLKFKSSKKLKIRTYTATAVKDGSLVSGDSFAFAGRGDKYYTVLCDGLGSGEEASRESNSTLDLLSKFLYSDFTEEQILKTLNSVLMIKLGDERYVTFDFTVIDYGTKEIRLYKAGAAPSYVLSGKNVDKISGKSLPMGILDTFEYSSFKKKVRIGDMVVMVTDGIIDSISQDPKKSLDRYLELIVNKDPQTLANSILSYALRGQDKIIDDMTVLVTKIG